jgi:hypothetical protein
VSDQLRTLTPDGREDVSLAAAFEIGRLLGLSQPALVAALVRWRSEQFGAARAAAVGDAVSKETPFAPGADGTGADGTGAGTGLGRLLGLGLMTKAGQAPEAVAGPTRPIADPGRPIELDGPLDQIVASGLGLDLPRLQEQARTQGMVAALAGTDVVVAGRGRVDQATVAGLRTTLDGEVTRLAKVAAAGRIGPPDVLAPISVTAEGASTGAAMAEAAPEPDALDDLLDALQRGEPSP